MSEDNKVKRKKCEKYIEERQFIIKRLDRILGLNEKNRIFFKDDILENEEKQKEIYDLEDEVKKYFAYTRWGYFSDRVELKWFCLLRCIYKDCGYELVYKTKKINGVKKTEYCIIEKHLG